jgi:HUS1 checkpoint protein
VLCLTITTSSVNGRVSFPNDDRGGDDSSVNPGGQGPSIDFTNNAVERETIITQDIPIRVLSSDTIDGIHQPRTREPDVHIILPPLIQLRSVSDRFTKLAVAAKASHSSISGLTSVGPRLEMSANMHGCLKIGISTDAMNISSTWTGLTNPELDPNQHEDGVIDIENHPSTRMKKLGDKTGKSEEGWAKVRIDGRDWSKVMSVGRLGANRVIAC